MISAGLFSNCAARPALSAACWPWDSLVGFYLTVCPFVAGNPQLLVAAFFVSAVLQLLIAVSMIVLVLEEARRFSQKAEEDLQTATVEKDRLATKVSLAEERYRTLFQQAQEELWWSTRRI